MAGYMLLPTVDIILIVVGSLMFVTLVLLLVYFLYKPESSPEEHIPLRGFRTPDASSVTTHYSLGANPANSGGPTPYQRGDDVENPIAENDTRKIVSNIFQEGNIYLHTSKGPRNVNFAITDVELQWSSPTTNKKYTIRLSELKHAEIGKKTANFQKKSSAEANESNCFSLVCQSTSIDIEAASKETRDRLVDAFNNIIATAPKDNTSPYGF